MQHVLFTLLTLGIIASLVAVASSELTANPQPKPYEMLRDVAKPQLYYVAHGIEITLLMSAGVIALSLADFRKIQSGYLLRFGLLLVGVFLMTMRGYTLSDLASTKLLDNTGPFPFLLSLLVFVGAHKSNWHFLCKLLVISAVVFSCMAVFGMTRLHSLTRSEAVATIGATLSILYWPASWIALRDCPQPSMWSPFRFIPMLIYSLGSLFVQTRLNFVMIFAVIGAYAYVQHKRNRPQVMGWIVAVAITVWAALFTAVCLRNTAAFEKVGDVANAFSSRLDEDTRTGQLASFAEDVEGWELLRGRGSFATWNWGSVTWRGGTDVGYLTLLLYGGLPLLVTYILTHVTPGLKILRANLKGYQLTAAAITLLWAVRMFSSDYPGYNPGYYFILLSIGACISRDFSD
jgi:hypothetical protein